MILNSPTVPLIDAPHSNATLLEISWKTDAVGCGDDVVLIVDRSTAELLESVRSGKVHLEVGEERELVGRDFSPADDFNSDVGRNRTPPDVGSARHLSANTCNTTPTDQVSSPQIQPRVCRCRTQSERNIQPSFN